MNWIFRLKCLSWKQAIWEFLRNFKFIDWMIHALTLLESHLSYRRCARLESSGTGSSREYLLCARVPRGYSSLCLWPSVLNMETYVYALSVILISCSLLICGQSSGWSTLREYLHFWGQLLPPPMNVLQSQPSSAVLPTAPSTARSALQSRLFLTALHKLLISFIVSKTRSFVT